ncbi:hypothetical protein [Clostridium cavendishii]|nr:hypothetical protein [Clostridium cavendishii]
MVNENINTERKYKKINSAKLQFSTFESEGEYNYLEMEYNAILNGDVKATKIFCTGETEIHGNVKTREMDLKGVTTVNGDISGNTIKIVGESKINGDIKFRDFTLNGTLVGSGSVTCTNFISDGKYTGATEVKAKTITASGQIGIETLDAGKIDLRLNKNSNIKFIKGETININLLNGIFSRFTSGSNDLEIDTIEGEDIVLTNIKAKKVIGKNIVLQKNCIIENLKYTGSLDKKDNSKVNNAIKVE